MASPLLSRVAAAFARHRSPSQHALGNASRTSSNASELHTCTPAGLPARMRSLTVSGSLPLAPPWQQAVNGNGGASGSNLLVTPGASCVLSVARAQQQADTPAPCAARKRAVFYDAADGAAVRRRLEHTPPDANGAGASSAHRPVAASIGRFSSSTKHRLLRATSFGASSFINAARRATQRARQRLSPPSSGNQAATVGDDKAKPRSPAARSDKSVDTLNSMDLKNSPVLPGATNDADYVPSAYCEALITSPGRAERYHVQRRLLYQQHEDSSGATTTATAGAQCARAEHKAVSEPCAPPPVLTIAASGGGNVDEEEEENKDIFTCEQRPARSSSASLRYGSVGCGPLELFACDKFRRLSSATDGGAMPLSARTPSSAGSGGTPHIGHGGFGSVFIARYNGKKVAIKQLHNRKSSGAGSQSNHKLQSLRCELNAFSLDHPNIVKILAFTSMGPVAQVVYEYVGRRNLQQCLDDAGDGTFAGDESKLCVARQMADALDYCHAHKVLHLDVKAANVLLTDYYLRCKLADFGCSRRLPSDCGELHGASEGTLIYQAPELLKFGRASARADVYAYGLMLWQVVFRRAPFWGVSAHAAVWQIVSRKLRPPIKWEQDDWPVWNPVNDIMSLVAQRCWAHDEAHRPRWEEILSMLRHADVPDGFLGHF